MSEIENLRAANLFLAGAMHKQAERIKALEDAINDADSVVTIELNPSNYDHDGVCLLNDQMIEAFSILTTALKGTPHG